MRGRGAEIEGVEKLIEMAKSGSWRKIIPSSLSMAGKLPSASSRTIGNMTPSGEGFEKAGCRTKLKDFGPFEHQNKDI